MINNAFFQCGLKLTLPGKSCKSYLWWIFENYIFRAKLMTTNFIKIDLKDNLFFRKMAIFQLKIDNNKNSRNSAY